MDKYREIYFPETRFGGFSNIDSSIIFYTRINALLTADSVILDVGCGRGTAAEDRVLYRKSLRILKGKCKKIIGIDLDKAGYLNPCIDEFRLITEKKWPVENESIDICICDNVLEHVENPNLFFSELSRVIKKEGLLFIRTTNLFSSFGFLSFITPLEFHKFILRNILHYQRERNDVFKTLFRCNTVFKIEYMFRKYKFKGCIRGYQSEPAYFAFSQFFYLIGLIFDYFTPNFLKTNIFCFASKN